MRYLIVGLMALLFAQPSGATGISIYAGLTKDWVKLDDRDDFEDFEGPMAGIAYDVVSAFDKTSGFALGYRISQDQFFAGQYTAEYWRTLMDNQLEVFAGGQGESWSRSDFFDDTEFLAGPRAGVRFDVRKLCFELSGSWSFGNNELERRGVFTGLYLKRDDQGGY